MDSVHKILTKNYRFLINVIVQRLFEESNTQLAQRLFEESNTQLTQRVVEESNTQLA